LQFITACTACCLDRHSNVDRCDEAGEIGGIGVGR
jgi:hypothetical protein